MFRWEDQRMRHVPVLFVDDYATAALRAGASDYVLKHAAGD
jgi:hypothetical protein